MSFAFSSRVARVVALGAALCPAAAHAQFSNQTGNVAGIAGGACDSASNDYAWPDANGNILKCVSNVWTLQGVTASAAGSNGQVQFNNVGALGASSNFYWDNTNGRVGIGTTSPGAPLEVYTSTKSGLEVITSNSGASNPALQIVDTNLSPNLTGVFTSNAPSGFGQLLVGTYSNYPLALETNNTERMRIDTSGNVGIGTTSPKSKLDVYGGVSLGAYGGTNAAPSNGLIVSGNVGIGTTSPAATLNVVGTITQSGGNVIFGPSTNGTQIGNAPGTSSDLNVGSGGISSKGEIQSNIAESNTNYFGNADFAADANYWWIQTDTAHSLRIDTYDAGANLNAMTIMQGGNVGIGTTAPQSTLSVSGGVAIGTTYAGTNAAGSNNLIVQGNVGIGVTSPSYMLDVLGTLHAGDIITAQKGMYLTGFPTSWGTASVSEVSGEFWAMTPSGKNGYLGVNGTQYLTWNSGGIAVAGQITSTGNVGIGSTSPVASLDLSQKNDALALPGGSNAQRPTGGALVNGEIRYNTAGTGAVEAYYNGAWNSLVTSATAGTSTPAAGSTGQVQFNSGGDLAASSSFYWDNTNGRVGIGITSPNAKSQVLGQELVGASPTGSAQDHLTFNIYGNNYAQLYDVGLGGTNGGVAIGGSATIAGVPSTPTMFWNVNTGNVGIGTTSPTQVFDARGNIAFGTTTNVNNTIYFKSAQTGGDVALINASVQTPGVDNRSNLNITSERALNLESPSGIGGFVGNLGGGGLAWDGVNSYTFTAQANTRIPLKIQAAAGQSADLLDVTGSGGSAGALFNISGTGNVGIGTTSPGSLLDVRGARVLWSSNQGMANIISNSSYSIDLGGSLGLGGSDGVNPRVFATIMGLKENSTSGNYQGYFAVGTHGGGGPGGPNIAERFRITSAGNVGIGSTAPVVSLDDSQFTDAIALPGGSNAQRPTGGALANGEIRYNTAGTGQVEAYYNGAWNSLVTSATAGTSTPAAGSTGQVQFNSGGDLAASSSFYWDNTNGRLGIGSTSPTYPLDINAWSARVRATGQNDADFIASNTSGNLYLGVDNATGTVMGLGEAYGRFIYSSGAYPLMFLTNGSNERMRITASGNVGIGTTSPAQLLHVLGPSGTRSTLAEFQETSQQAFYIEGQTGSGDIGATNGALLYTSGGNLGLRNGNSGNATILINSASNVGIGTVLPANKLDVNGSLAVGTYAGTATGASNELIVSGNVGIGITNPAYLLDIQTTSGDGVERIRANDTSGAATLNLWAGNNAVGSKYAYVRFYNYDVGSGDWRVGTYSTDNFSIYDAKASAERLRIDGSGNVGIGSTIPVSSLDLSQKTDALALPGGSNAQRPTGTSLVNGEIRYNTAGTGQVEAYYNGAWNSLVTSATAGTSTPAAGSTGQVQFNSGGDLAASSSFYWDNTNSRLGIGTTSPATLLDVNGDTSLRGNTRVYGSTSYVYINDANTANDRATFWWNKAGNYGGAGTLAAGQSAFGNFNNYLSFKNGLVVDNSGNVGIGTASPASLLHVAQDGGSILLTRAAGSYGTRIYQEAPAGNIRYQIKLSDNATWQTFMLLGEGLTSAGANIRLQPTAGGVSIGNASPLSLLDVAGNLAVGTYAGSTAAPTNGMIVSGNVGIGTTAPGNTLDVNGAASIGYPGTAAPSSGLIVSGYVTIGTTVVGSDSPGLTVARNATINGVTIGKGWQGGGDVVIGSITATLGASTSDVETIAIGYAALSAQNYSGYSYDVAVGSYSMRYATTTLYSTAVGGQALSNTAFNGNGETAIGYYAGKGVTTGNYNIAIGYEAGQGGNIGTGANNIVIGQNNDVPTANGSNQLNIGNLIYGTNLGSGSTVSTGNVGIGTTSPAGQLDVYKYTTSLQSGATLKLTRSYTYGTAIYDGVLGGNETLVFGVGSASDPALAGNERMVVNSAGNVGIGTTGPVYMLDVNAGNTAGIRITNSNANPWALMINNATYGNTNAKGFGFYQDTNGNGVMATANQGGAGNYQFVLGANGNVGIGTTAPDALLSLGGGAARVIDMVRNTTANTAGNGLTIQAGGATSAATDKNGGTLTLTSGISTGTGSSNIQFNVYPAAGSGSSDNAATTAMTILGNGNVGIGTTGPDNVLSVANPSTGYETLTFNPSTATLGVGNQANHALPGIINIYQTNGGLSGYITVDGSSLDLSGNGGSVKLKNTSALDGQSAAHLIGFFGESVLGNNSSTGAALILYNSTSTTPALKIGTTSGTINSVWLANGSVGIGTTSPQDQLQIGTDLTLGYSWPRIQFNSYYNGSNNVYLLSKSSSMIQQDYTRGGLGFYVAASGTAGATISYNEAVVIGTSGNVGIGTTSPQATLDVNGYARLALQSSAPATCSGANTGAIALNHLAQMCACNGTSWVFADSVGAACSW